MCKYLWIRAVLALACVSVAACADLEGAAGTADGDASGGQDVAHSSCAVDALAPGDSSAFKGGFVDPQYALLLRSPGLGATVCNAIQFSWTFVKDGDPELAIGFGARHDAGDLPPGPYWYTSNDGHSYLMEKPFVWPGPGRHVHLVAYTKAGKLILDPFFEYELAVGE